MSEYYSSIYWDSRDIFDRQHIPKDNVPNEIMLSLTQERLDWIFSYTKSIKSVIDFGAGDAAGGYLLKNKYKLGVVHIVDPSVKTRLLSELYGLAYSAGLASAPTVDLIYSAHSIEHVHDLCLTLKKLLSKIKPGGFIFFETPNIGDCEVFKNLVHTPHTFMLSHKTFYFLETVFPVKVVAIEKSGPTWQANFPKIRSTEKADLRILLQYNI